jgi:hypothetical protein
LYESVSVVDDSLVSEIERVALTPSARRFMIERAAELFFSMIKATPERVDQLHSELSRVRREQENLLRAVESGHAPGPLVDRLRERQQEREKIEREIHSLRTV